MTRRAVASLTLAAAVFTLTLAVRVHGISRHFAMLGDQIRDWDIALGPFRDLPLVGPATHVGGYTIGPAFYWILWAIRVTVGPWFDNLPHGGGIGQAIVQSAADVLLLVAIWRRTGSVWLATAAVTLIATAPHDLALAALVWNPTMGSALAKIATALVLLEWPFRSLSGVAVTTAVAWAAVHSYTGAIFATIGVFASIVAGLFGRGERTRALQSAVVIAIVVAALQIPYVLYRMSPRAGPAMGAVTESVGRILTGQARPDFAGSWNGFAGGFTFIQGAPWHQQRWPVWLLTACAIVVVAKHRRDPALLSVTIVPLTLAVIGYAFFVGPSYEAYYYLSLMPAAVLTVVLGLTAMPSPKAARAVAVGLATGALVVAPLRVQFAATLPRMPEYGPLLDGSRRLVERASSVRTVRTRFPLPPTADPEFLYQILGGHIDPSSPANAVIGLDGQVTIESTQARE